MTGYECQDCTYYTQSTTPIIAYLQAQNHAEALVHNLIPSSTVKIELRNITAQKMQDNLNKLAKAKVLTPNTPIRHLILVAEDN